MTTKQKQKRASSLRGQAPTRARTRKKKYPSQRPIDRELLAASEVQLRPKDIPAAQAIFLEQIERHGSPSRACIAAGVGRRTFYDWLHAGGEFRQGYHYARRVWRMAVVDDVESAFGERAQVRDTLAGIVLLKNNRKRYREVSRVQLSGPDGGPIVTLEAKEELIKRLQKLEERARQKEQIIGGVAVGELPAGSTGSRGPQGPQLGIVRAGSAGSERGVRKVKRDY